MAITAPTIRLARADEADALTDLSMRSKAYWGYDADFMRLCQPVLTLSVSTILAGRVWVAEMKGTITGIVSVDDADAASSCTFELARLFVEPGCMGQGIGRHLFDKAVDWIRSNGGGAMEILADPDTVSFYTKMGARQVGDAPSDAVPGRRLPLLVIDIPAG